MTDTDLRRRCATCGGRLDIRDVHITVIRTDEVHERGAITVLDSTELASIHPGCERLNPPRYGVDVCDTCGTRIPRGERYLTVAAVVEVYDHDAITVLNHSLLAAMHPRCERTHRSGRW